MRRLLALIAVVVVCAAGAEKKKKLPDLEVLELKVHRLDGKVTIDGRVRNSGEKQLQGVIVFFDFLATGSAVITTQKTALEEEVLEPGKEATFRGELVDPVRAVECRINTAEDKGGRDLRLAKVIKVPIE
jgi:hypothetical protein